MDHIEDAFNQLPENFDAFWLGSNLQSEHFQKISTNLYRLENGWNTHAIILTKKFIRWCLDNWSEEGLVFDEWLRQVAQKERECYVIYPISAIQRPSNSDIQNSFCDYTEAWNLTKQRYK